MTASRRLAPALFVLAAFGLAVLAADTKPTDTKPTAGPFSPAESMQHFTVPADLHLDQVLAEPVVRQPVSFSFDERGRLWVVQYLQYPAPAGLTVVSRDKFWRTVYDKVPAPPPHHVRGEDKVTIHEDSRGTGVYDKHTTFVDGLNIATATARGRGGVFVLNPPYLLFYPCAGNSDVPTADPEVLLEGFGLEDTHSVVNSLCWGPDGWLYAAQGSTVTGHIRQPGSKEPPVHSLGQLIWRYHPESRRYEIFAEGGGNAFGVEFDAQGRVYSGYNGGDTRGFHYVQGGYYRKGFEKHGPLSNPYAFGYFPPMKHNTTPRFSHTFVINDDAALPERYRGKLFAADPLQGHLVMAEVKPDGSSRRTRDVEAVIKSDDRFFRPVHVKMGPDGAIYVADWYDRYAAHLDHNAGRIDKDGGRIYRLRAADARPAEPFDHARKSTAELVELLRHPHRWHRQTALRLLGDRKDPAAIPLLKKMLFAEQGRTALEALWGLNLSGGFDEPTALRSLDHVVPAVRSWTVRLLCDDKKVSPALAARLAILAHTEPDVEVRSQVACSARRLPADQGLPITAALLHRDEDAGDVFLPLLLWWAIEAKCDKDRDAVLALFADPTLWRTRIVTTTILPRLVRRFAAAGSTADFLTCARVFKMAPDRDAGLLLLKGFEEAFKGRGIGGLPQELLEETAKLGGGSVALGVRQGRKEAVDKAMRILGDPKARPEERLDCVEVFGEVRQPRCVPALLAIVRGKSPDALRKSALTALEQYDSADIGAAVVAAHDDLPVDVRAVAQTLLLSRKNWSLQMVEAVERGAVSKENVPADLVRRLAVLKDQRLSDAIRRVWGEVKGATTEEMRREIERLGSVVRNGKADPYAGKKLFTASCANCHSLFGKGGSVGPDLTSYRRDDLGAMLLNVVNPSAEIREGYENHVVVTESGRTLTGVLLEQDPKTVVLRTPDGQRVAIAREDVAEMSVSGVSLMPEGLLKGLTDQQVRDLFGYLRSTQPLNE
jgi:putative heme-binding domain-containing protein